MPCSANTVLAGSILWWAVLHCAPASIVPMVPRPDTRALDGVIIDSSTMRQTVVQFRNAFPKESAVCFYGALMDSAIDGRHRRLIRVTSVRPAFADSANEFHVWIRSQPRSGCSGSHLVGIAHDHPYAQQAQPCTHSDPDSDVLFADPRALFTMVLCADGRAEVFFQDGRRAQDRWYRAAAPP